jgi:hypothetical protein
MTDTDTNTGSPYKIKISTDDSWKQKFREVILEADSLPAALAKLETDVIEYTAARETDPEFDRIASLYERAMDHRIIDNTRRKALEGDIKHLTLYVTKIRVPSPQPQEAAALNRRPAAAAPARQPAKKNEPYHEPKPLKPGVAAAMIAAGLAAMGELPEESPVPEPLKNPPKIKPSDYALLELDLGPPATQFVPVSASPATHPPSAPAAPLLLHPAARPPGSRKPQKKNNDRRRQFPNNGPKSPASRPLPSPPGPESSPLILERGPTRTPFSPRQAPCNLFPEEPDRPPTQAPPAPHRKRPKPR